MSRDLSEASDWRRVRLEGVGTPRVEAQLEIIRRLRERAGDEVMLFTTMFGPFQHACSAASDARMMAHCAEDPESVRLGASAMTVELERCAEAFLDAGADGLYYSAQYGEIGRFSHEEWSTLVRPMDLRILDCARHRGKRILLHICGERMYDAKIHLDWYADYPADIVNWSISDNGLSLAEGRALFHRPVLGGMNNRGSLGNGTLEEVVREANAAIEASGGEPFMLGADCTIRGERDLDRIAAAVQAAHTHRTKEG